MGYGKKIFTLLVILIFLTTVFTSVSISSENIEVEKIEKIYTFEKPTVSKININEKTLDRISMNKATNDGDIGSPSLPFYSYQVLLPRGTIISSISATPGKEITLGTGYNIEPVLEPVKISEINKISTKQQINYLNFKDTKIIIETIGTYSFRGYSIFYFNLYPVNYYSANKELTYFENIKVVISLIKDENVNTLYRGSQVDENEVLKKIDNVEMISTYKQKTSPLNGDFYDLLIVTTNNFLNNFMPLKIAHDGRGLKTEIKTFNNFDSPETLRDFIKNEYLNYGIEYVLIGGDHDIIPSKMLWVQAWAGADETTMPVDMYFGCLDGTFNYDEDELWGEPKDGPNGGDVDLLAEVYVGRAPVGDGEEADRFVRKSIQQMNSDYSTGNSLLVGELLSSNPYTWGGDYMDQLVDKCIKNAYTTNGIPSDTYTIEKLYDRDHPENNWPVTDLINLINNGVKMVNHLGHSSYNYNMKMINEDVFLLTNSEPFLVYSQGCMAGGFDYPDYDCIAEFLTVITDYGAFAAVMCARYGWFVIGSTNGASQKFHRQFVDAIFGEHIPEIGKANHDSKEDNIKFINSACMRWCYYETNLLGDPALTFYSFENSVPDKPQTPVGASNGEVDLKYSFSTLTYDSDNDSLYFRFEWGDENLSKWVGPYKSGEEVSISHSWSKKGTYQVKVKARDEHYAISPWSESFIITIIKYKSVFLNLFETLMTRYPKIVNLFFKF